jgi:hypothetical protein
MATEVLYKAIGANSQVLGVDNMHMPDCDGWDVSSLELSGRRGTGEYRKQDVRAGEDTKDQEFTVRAELSSPLELALRYETQTRTEYDRSLDRLLKLKKRRNV